MTLRTCSTALALSAAALLWLAPVARAADTCKPIDGVLSATFDIATSSFVGGPFYIKVGNEVVSGRFLPAEQAPTKTCDGLYCHEVGARIRLDLGTGDTVLVEAKSNTYRDGLGFTPASSNGSVIGGTGRFEKVTGTYTQNGAVLSWIDPRDGQFRAQYRGTISGSVCGMK